MLHVFTAMLFTIIFLNTILFFANLFFYFFLHLPLWIARLIAGGEKYCKHYDFVNKVSLLLFKKTLCVTSLLQVFISFRSVIPWNFSLTLMGWVRIFSGTTHWRFWRGRGLKCQKVSRTVWGSNSWNIQRGWGLYKKLLWGSMNIGYFLEQNQPDWKI